MLSVGLEGSVCRTTETQQPLLFPLRGTQRNGGKRVPWGEINEWREELCCGGLGNAKRAVRSQIKRAREVKARGNWRAEGLENREASGEGSDCGSPTGRRAGKVGGQGLGAAAHRQFAARDVQALDGYSGQTTSPGMETSTSNRPAVRVL